MKNTTRTDMKDADISLKSSPTLFKRIAISFGIEIFNIDENALQDKQSIDIRSLVQEHKVVVVRDQNLTNEQLFGFSQQLGIPVKYAFSNGVNGYPEIIEIHRRSDQITAMSTMWHSDSTYLQAPPDFTILYGVDIPPFGGNTAFADTVAAFADLSVPLKDFLKNRKIVNRSDLHLTNERLSHLSKPVVTETALVAIHPAVHVDSETGEESIYVNEEHSSHFDGMTTAESRPIINFLVKHIAQDKYRADISWQPRTLLISDNRTTQHRAIDNYYGHSRTLRRVIVAENAS